MPSSRISRICPAVIGDLQAEGVGRADGAGAVQVEVGRHPLEGAGPGPKTAAPIQMA